MKKNEFFRKATLLICSSLEIEVALSRCREFLDRYIPADEMTLNIYDHKAKTVRYLAIANRSGCQLLNLGIKPPTNLIESIETGQRLKEYLVINDAHQDPLGKPIAKALGITEASFISLRLSVEGMRIGVVDLFAYGKNRFSVEDARLFSLVREPLAIAMANALKHREMVKLKDRFAEDNRYLNRKLFNRLSAQVIGADSGLKDVMQMVNQVASLNNTVLLLGETGVGKEVIANAICHASPRRDGPFVKVNCGAIPESLIDSELFGHEKGSFTGAVKQKRGLFERADRGTIFLDEIGELPMPAQIRLLRVLQTHEIERVGGSPPIHLDIRVIAATHRNLQNLVSEGRFREDLWFRINSYPIQIPPLRKRKEDIPILVRFFVEKKARELGLRSPRMFSRKEISPLLEYDWPGNVRELENVVERTLIQQRSGPLVPGRLIRQPMAGIRPDNPEGKSNPVSIDQLVSEHLRKVIRTTDGRIYGPKGAAALLRIHPSTLRNRLDKLKISYGRRYRSEMMI